MQRGSRQRVPLGRGGQGGLCSVGRRTQASRRNILVSTTTGHKQCPPHSTTQPLRTKTQRRGVSRGSSSRPLQVPPALIARRVSGSVPAPRAIDLSGDAATIPLVRARRRLEAGSGCGNGLTKRPRRRERIQKRYICICERLVMSLLKRLAADEDMSASRRFNLLIL